VKVEIRELEELVREVSIEIEPAEVNKKLESKFSEVQRDVTLKGFRKGHAPLNIIKSQFADEVKADVADELIKATISEALRERALPVATPPTVTDLNYTDNGGFNYTARVEVFPTIPPIAFDNLKVSFYDLTVTDEEVDRAAEQVRKAYAERRTVTRAVGEGDIVVVDLVQTFDSPKEEPEKAYPDSVIELSNPLTVKEFREQLPGLTAGDTREIEVHYAADYPDEEFAGATVRYRTTVKEVREEIQPAFDDYLAKRTGHAQTALELRMKIREDLKAQKERELRRYHRNEIVQQVIERNKVSVPAGLVKEYLDAMVKDLRRQDSTADEAELRGAYHGMATAALQWNLLSDHIARQENIQVTREDTDKVIKRFAENYEITEAEAREGLRRSGKYDNITDTLREEKVLDFLISKAEVVKKE